MCIASLHLSTQPCAHRWYQLVRSCDSEVDLRSCPQKLKLEGWEKRTESCPWCVCDDTSSSEGTSRLLNGTSTMSAVDAELATTPPQRTDSFAALSTLSTLSRHSSVASAESDSGQRHREMNERVRVYLTTQPHDILPSASKNYPTYSQNQGQQVGEGPQSRKFDSQKSKDGVTRRFKKGIRLSMQVWKP